MQARSVFVDANVFLEIRWKEKGWQSSFEVVEGVRRGEIKGFTSVLSSAIIYFFYSREFARKRVMVELAKTLRKFEIADNTSAHAKAAMKDRRFVDFEDALQFYSAKTVAKILITRNKKDYKKVSYEIEVLTPEEFMKKYGQPKF